MLEDPLMWSPLWKIYLVNLLVNVYDVTNSTDPLIMYGNQYKEGDVSLVHECNLFLEIHTGNIK
jgi:hypothetical protein